MATNNAFDPMTLLQRPMEEVKALPPMPLGSYVAVAIDYAFDETKPKDGTKAPTKLVKVTPRLVEAFPDVDKEQLAEALNGKNLTDIEQRPIDFFLTEAAGFRLKEFLEHAHLGTEDGVATMAEGLEQVKDGTHQFGVEITAVRNDRDPNRPFHQITRTFRLPD